MWRTLYLASIQCSVSLQNKCDLFSQKDGPRKAINRSRQDMVFYYTTHSTWKLHSFCTHMPWMSNTSSFQMLLLIILQRSRLKSNFRGSRVCLVDSDLLSTFPGVTLDCTDVTKSRIRPGLQQSKNNSLITVTLCIMCAGWNLAGAAVWFQYVPKGRIWNIQIEALLPFLSPQPFSSLLIVAMAGLEVETGTLKLLGSEEQLFFFLHPIANPTPFISSLPPLPHFAEQRTFKQESDT